MSTKGIVSSAHTLISSSGLKVFNQGGNAMDAAIAMALTSGVVLPDMCGFGADAFLLYYDAKSKKITAINGSSFAPKKGSIEYMKSLGYSKVPDEGIYSITLPGAVDTYFTALHEFGSMPFSVLAKDAISLARDGVPASEKVVRHMHTDLDKMRRFNALSKQYLKDDQPYQTGDLLINEDYAKAIEYVCEHGREGFYKGKIAKDIEETTKGYITVEDLSRVHCEILDPICVNYRDYIIYNTPPISQGILHLEEMNILDQFDISKYPVNSAKSIHLMAEIKKIAFYDRNTYFGDPAFVDNPTHKVLSKQYAKECASKIKMDTCLEENIELGIHHTTSFVAVDKWGNAVSMIHSIAATWGSGIMVDGFLLNNRGCQFSFDPHHPNALQPYKKTMHTLNTYIITDQNGNLRYVGNTPGGDYQPQWNMQNIVNVIDYKMDVQSALEHAKWTEHNNMIRIESQCGKDTIEQLKKMGHMVEIHEPYTLSGASQLIEVRGKLKLGGCDPRCDGAAMPEI